MRRIPIFWIATVGTLAIGLWNAIRLRWVCDDAFITFRYVDNLVSGHGPVYNVGERVEGYTHFLWLCLLALLRRLGCDPVLAAEWLGIVSFAATLGLFAWITRTLCRGKAAILPLASLMLALHYDVTIWASGGLETAFFTLLVAVSFATACVWQTSSPARPVLTGAVLALAVMTRPDGAVFLGLAVLFMGAEAYAEGRSSSAAARRALLVIIPVAAMLVPWLVWKLVYYGNLLPNTYYAKSAGTAYYHQGFAYLWLYFRAYLSSLLFVVGLAWLLAARLRGRSLFADREHRVVLLALAYLIGYSLLFVARVGGDFMYARFLIPVVPYAYLALEVGLRRFIGRRTWILVPLLLLLPLHVLHEKARRNELYFDRQGNARDLFGPQGITDEHWFYTHREGGRTMIEAYETIGKQLAVYFRGTDTRVILGGQASLGYYGQFRVCIERWGLTDPTIAHMPVAKRARIGHEKSAPWDYLIRRGVQFEFLKRPFKPDPYRSVYFRVGDDTVRGELITYDRALMRHLAEEFPNDVRFIDFVAYLDDWLKAMPDKPVEQVRKDYEEFREFYFLHNPDPEREERILAYLRTRTER